MYQVTVIITWNDKDAGDRAHRDLVPGIMGRWQAKAPTEARATVARTDDETSVFHAEFLSADGVTNDPWRQTFRKLVTSILRGHVATDGIRLHEGPVLLEKKVPE